MATYFWALPPGESGDFDAASNWFNVNPQPGDPLVPGLADTIQVVGAVPDLLHPTPVELVIAPGKTDTVKRLQVVLQSVDEDFVWIKGNLSVLEEVFFQNDRGNLRLKTGAFTLDGATMDVDYVHVGGAPLTSARNAISIDDDAMFQVTGGARVTTRRLEVLGTGGLAISNGGTVDVAGPATIQRNAGSIVLVEGTNSALSIDGNLVLDGKLRFDSGASGAAHGVSLSSTVAAQLIVGGSQDFVSSFRAETVALGDGGSKFGTLEARRNGHIIVDQTVTMFNSVTDASTFSGVIRTNGAGSIEIGGHTGLVPDDTIQIDQPAIPLHVGLVGHGLIRTGTLNNFGTVGVQGGTLFVSADVVGNGIFFVADGSSLEVDGKFDKAGTVSLTGGSTLILDRPDAFAGRITAVDFGDTIKLNNTGSAFANSVTSAVITADADGQYYITIFQKDSQLAINYKIDATVNLAGLRLNVLESADHKSTSLKLDAHGTTTSYYLDANGKSAVALLWGDDLGGNTDVFVNPDYSVVAADKGFAPDYQFFDYRYQQLNGYVHSWTTKGITGFVAATYDNSELAPLDPAIDIQIPSTPDPQNAHNLWYFYRHGPIATLTGDDGLGHFVNELFDDGSCTFISVDPTVTGGLAALSPEALGASPTDGTSSVQASPPFFRLTSLTWSPDHVPLAITVSLPTVNGGTTTSWVLNSEGSYTRTAKSVNFPTPEVSTETAEYVRDTILPFVAGTDSSTQPIVALSGREIAANPAGLISGRVGTPVADVLNQPASGRVIIDPVTGGFRSQDAVSPLVGDNGALLVGDNGALLVSDHGGARIALQDASKLIGQDAAGLVGQDGAGIAPEGASMVVATGGGSTLAAGGATLMASAGGNIIAGGGGNTVDAGGGNMFKLWGTGTPGRYVANALVFADGNGNGALDNGEAWTVTDAQGHYQLYGGWGTLVLAGGMDTGTNLPFKSILKAPLGSTDISSLTTLASGLAGNGGDIDGAIDKVQAALGLDIKLDFTVIDPIASTENGDAASAKIYIETSKTMDTVLLMGAAFAGLGADRLQAQQAAFDAMVGAITKTGALNLSDKTTVDGLIVAVGSALGTDASKIAGALSGSIASTSQLLDKLLVQEGAGIDLTSGITMIETGVQGALVSSFKASGGEPGKLGPAPLLLQAVSDDGMSVVTPGHVVTITVTTSETVMVNGGPTLQLGNGKLAMFAGGSGSSALVFKYTVHAGDGNGASELQVTGLNLAAGATIKDASGNNLAGTVTGLLGLEIDAGAVASLAVTDAVKAEGQGGATPFTFTVTRTGDTTASHSVSWVVTGLGAGPAQVDGLDFTGGVLPSGTVTFAAGETSRTITLDVVGGNGVEPDEGFKVSLSNPTSGLVIGTASAVGTILNDDATVSVGAVSAVKAEGNGATTSFTFNLAVGGDISVAHTVSYAVVGAGINPASGADFAGGVLPGGTVTLAIGESSKTIIVEVMADAVIEADEGFAVELSSPSAGLVIGAASASGKIVNDDASVSIAAQSAVIAEGDSGTTPFTFTVTRSGDLTVGHSVSWSIVGSGVDGADPADIGGTALNGGTLTFAAGETTRTILVEVIGDAEIEFDEEFTVSLHNPSVGLLIGVSSAIGTIQNDDGNVVSIAALSAAKAEENSGTTPFTFTVTLNQAGVTAQTVDWAVTGSAPNAADGADFDGALPSGTVTFAAGETSKTITLPVSGDTIVEPDNFFTVTLSNPSAGLTLGPASAVGIIQNDDRATLSIAALAAAKPEGNSGTTSFTFTVSLDQASFEGQTANWAVTGSSGNAANAADFGGTLPSGIVSFAAGETSKVVTVGVSGDALVELEEGFEVTLSTLSAGLVLGVAFAAGTIQNDDRSTVSIAALSAVKAEGNSGTTATTFTVSLSQAGVTTQTVSWAVAGSGANPAGAADFAGGVLPGGVVTFAPGETSKVVTVNVAGDSTVESDEGYSVTLSGLSAGLVASVASAAGTIQNDDVAVAVAAHDDAYVVLRGQSLTVTASVLSNDVAGATATLLSGPAHGTLQLAGNGTFTYTAATGFSGIDSFTYRASNGGSTDDGQVHVHVVPVNAGGGSTTLGLLTLTAEEQIASTYAAFFGRGADKGGFGFWVGQFVQNLPTQGPAALFANIASSFGISEEAKALYPFLVNPFTATDNQISAFLDSVYNNLFGRSSDAGGLGYWTDQIKQTLQAGQFVGSILVNIMSGAQDTAAGKDITTLMGKVAVSLAFVREQEEHHTAWAGASDTAAATTLLQAVTADPQSVLVGVRNAESLIAAHA